MKRLWVLRFFLLGFVLIGVGRAWAQDEGLIFEVARVDTTDFPVIRLNLFTADSRSVPLSDLSRLSMRENGVPVEFTLNTVPVGADLVFVVDTNELILGEDDAGVSRWQKVKASIGRFATRFMNPNGLDKVSIVVPDGDGEGGMFLVQDETDPTAVVAAVEAYVPVPLETVPVADMMQLAMAHLVAREGNGRFHALLLFSDASQLHTQLEYETITAQAQAARIAVFPAILGAQASSQAVENARRLATATRGFHVFMPQPEEADAIYLVWQRQANQPQIQYRTLRAHGGQYTVTLNLGQVRAMTEFEVTILPPELLLEVEEVLYRRGAMPDAPVDALEPKSVDVPLLVSWPDGRPRRLTDVVFSVNGRLQPPPLSFEPDETGRILLPWNMTALGEGSYELRVEVVDELGLVANSDPVTVRLLEERPLPPTPTPIPTSAPTVTIPSELPLTESQILWLLGSVALASIFLLVVRWQRRRDVAHITEWVETAIADVPPHPEEGVAPLGAQLGLVGWLERVDDASAHSFLRLPGADVTIGRDAGVADLVFADRTVSPLHARIRWDNGRYWLYDEGSSNGTYLNFVRLGLAPQALNDLDHIGIGRLAFRFHLRPDEEE